ncbi:MAG: hypothetical protein ACE149_08845 [Armatimonadota bacterium]
MRRLVVGIAVVALMAGWGWAWGDPALTGPTGLVTVPTADTLGLLKWNVGASKVWTDDGPDESAIYANLGLLPRLEVGFTRLKPEGGDAETVLNAKFRVIGLPGRITLAVGAVDLTDQMDQSAYAVISHDLGAGVVSPKGQLTRPQLHVGYGGGQFDGLFGGVSVIVGGKADVMAEYDGDDFNMGVRWPIIPKVLVTAAAMDGLSDLALGVCLKSPW